MSHREVYSSLTCMRGLFWLLHYMVVIEFWWWSSVENEKEDTVNFNTWSVVFLQSFLLIEVYTVNGLDWESVYQTGPFTKESCSTTSPIMSQGGDMNARFARMNVNAQPFIPNAGAQPFVPAVYPPYGYPAHGMYFSINVDCSYRGKTASSCLKPPPSEVDERTCHTATKDPRTQLWYE